MKFATVIKQHFVLQSQGETTPGFQEIAARQL